MTILRNLLDNFFICNTNVHLLILFNPGYHGNNHYMEKRCMESLGYTFILSKNPSCLKEIGIPFISGFYIRFVYFLFAL